MYSGKKSTAETAVYKTFEIIKEKAKVKNPIEIFELALTNTAPNMEVRSKRVGGANYQVPIEVRPERKAALSMKWIIEAARGKKEDAESEQQEMLKNWTPEWEKPAIQMNADGVPTHMPNIATSEEGGPINKRSTPPLNVGQVRMPSGKKHV